MPARATKKAPGGAPFPCCVIREVAEWTGLEPATSGVTGQHSNQLNYHSAVPREDGESYRSGSARRNSQRAGKQVAIRLGPEVRSQGWWVLRVSNPRPSPCKGDALPLS